MLRGRQCCSSGSCVGHPLDNVSCLTRVQDVAMTMLLIILVHREAPRRSSDMAITLQCSMTREAPERPLIARLTHELGPMLPVMLPVRSIYVALEDDRQMPSDSRYTILWRPLCASRAARWRASGPSPRRLRHPPATLTSAWPDRPRDFLLRHPPGLSYQTLS